MSWTVLVSMNSNRKSGFLARNLSGQSSLLDSFDHFVVHLKLHNYIVVMFLLWTFWLGDMIFWTWKEGRINILLKVIRIYKTTRTLDHVYKDTIFSRETFLRLQKPTQLFRSRMSEKKRSFDSSLFLIGYMTPIDHKNEDFLPVALYFRKNSI